MVSILEQDSVEHIRFFTVLINAFPYLVFSLSSATRVSTECSEQHRHVAELKLALVTVFLNLSMMSSLCIHRLGVILTVLKRICSILRPVQNGK
jgi:hypothetical protein